MNTTTIPVEQWYTEHAEAVRTFLLRRCGDRHLADDLTHDTFVRAMRIAGGYEDRGKPRAWLYTVARNLLTDHRKAAGTSRTVLMGEVREDVTLLGGSGPVAEPHDSVVVGEARQVLTAAIRRACTDEQARAVTMRYLRGMTIQETAEALQATQGKVKALCYRASGALLRDPAVAALREATS